MTKFKIDEFTLWAIAALTINALVWFSFIGWPELLAMDL